MRQTHKTPTTLLSRIYRLPFNTLLVIFSLPLLLINSLPASSIFAISSEQKRIIDSGARYFDIENGSISRCPAGSGAGGELSNNVPTEWRNLILEAAPTYPDVDPRIVAAVLGVEHNIGSSGQWPEYRSSGWSESPRGARGPFQFIPQTWFGWGRSPLKTDWSGYDNNSNYHASGMGTDGDGDGIRDANNPKDAVHAAFKHHLGSASKPIAVRGFEQGASFEQNLRNTVFEREASNLLYYGAKYNGSGATTGQTIEQMRGGGENKNYVVAVFTLLVSDFTKAYDYGRNEFKDISSEANPGNSGSSSPGCGGSSSQVPVSADGFAFPLNIRQGELGGPSWEPGNTHPYEAVDIMIPEGTIVVAARAGTVIREPRYTTPNNQTGGLSIQILGDDGNIYFYTHLGKDTHLRYNISQGTQVSAGQPIGLIGSDIEGVNGSHLHFDVIKGPPENDYRGGCSRSSCPISDQFIDAKPALKESFNLLPQ